MKTDDHRRGPNIYFYRLGLAGSDRQQDNGWKMRSLPSIVKALNDTDVSIAFIVVSLISLGTYVSSCSGHQSILLLAIYVFESESRTLD
jgi:hypothetical protein